MPFSFSNVDASGQIVSMWCPKTSAFYQEDCYRGREYADEVVSAIRNGESPALLGWIVRGFGQDEARRGVETGFCQRLAEYLLS
jgi:hypothetical protein